jgi:hypothetical protein
LSSSVTAGGAAQHDSVDAPAAGPPPYRVSGRGGRPARDFGRQGEPAARSSVVFSRSRGQRGRAAPPGWWPGASVAEAAEPGGLTCAIIRRSQTGPPRIVRHGDFSGCRRPAQSMPATNRRRSSRGDTAAQRGFRRSRRWRIRPGRDMLRSATFLRPADRPAARPVTRQAGPSVALSSRWSQLLMAPSICLHR